VPFSVLLQQSNPNANYDEMAFACFDSNKQQIPIQVTREPGQIIFKLTFVPKRVGEVTLLGLSGDRRVNKFCIPIGITPALKLKRSHATPRVGHHFNLRLSSNVDLEEISNLSMTLTDPNDSQVACSFMKADLSFTPMTEGKHVLRVFIDDQLAEGCPLTFEVEPKPSIAILADSVAKTVFGQPVKVHVLVKGTKLSPVFIKITNTLGEEVPTQHISIQQQQLVIEAPTPTAVLTRSRSKGSPHGPPPRSASSRSSHAHRKTLSPETIGTSPLFCCFFVLLVLFFCFVSFVCELSLLFLCLNIGPLFLCLFDLILSFFGFPYSSSFFSSVAPIQWSTLAVYYILSLSSLFDGI